MNRSYLVRNEAKKKVYTVQVLKEFGFILAAVNFTFEEGILTTIEFNSYKFGITKYSVSENKFRGSLWETESDAKEISNLNYHYTSISISGTSTNKESDLLILNSVLGSIKDEELNLIIESAIEQKENSANEIEEYFIEKCF
jgi:hypothetical protein